VSPVPQTHLGYLLPSLIESASPIKVCMNCFSFEENKNPQKVVQATTVSAKVFGIKVDETKNVGKKRSSSRS